jgi:hypothetical protein
VLVVDVLQFFVILGTLIFIGLEVRQQGKEIKNQSVLRGFRLYHTLVQQYLDLLARADRDPELNAVWDVLEPARHRELDEAQGCRPWGAWHKMTVPERRCYRLVRNLLETFEQAYVIHRLFHEHGWMDEETWEKWRGWMAIWKSSPYFTYVFADSRPRMIKTFTDTFQVLATVEGGHDGTALLRVPEPRTGDGGDDGDR